MRSIDAVITWVDGSDKEYKKKIEKHLSTSTNYKKHYLQANEIEYCVKSILRFAPFVRRIFIFISLVLQMSLLQEPALFRLFQFFP